MTLTRIPDEPIPASEVHTWSTYQGNLHATPLVEEYLGGPLRRWVESETIQNPLALPWLRGLVDGTLDHLEALLKDLETAMGRADLCALLSDLLRRSGPLLDVRRDIGALYGEIVAFRLLKERGAKEVHKLTSRGDWLADGLTVSVKTILDIDHNYRQIEDAFTGLAWLADCPSVRSVGHFRVSKARGLDNKLMNKVLGFFDSDMERTLAALCTNLPFGRWTSCHVDALRIPELARTEETGRLHFPADRYDSENLLLMFEDIRERTQEEHGVSLELQLRSDASRTFSTSCDLDAWWGWPQVDQARLGKQVRDALQRIASRNERKPTSDFIGWINIEAHPSLQTPIAKQPARMKDFLAAVVEGTPFPVRVCIYGGFELQAPLVIPFGPPARFAEPLGESDGS